MNKDKKLNREMKIGLALLSSYFLWSLGWFIYSFLFKGSLTSPYVPTSSLHSELLKVGEAGFLLGTDIYGRSLLEVVSKGLFYSLIRDFLVVYLLFQLMI